MNTKQLIDYLELFIEAIKDELHHEDVKSGGYAEAYLKGSLETAELILGKVNVDEK